MVRRFQPDRDSLTSASPVGGACVLRARGFRPRLERRRIANSEDHGKHESVRGNVEVEIRDAVHEESAGSRERAEGE